MNWIHQCKQIVLFMTLFLLVGCSPKERYIADCKDNPVFETSLSVLYGKKGMEHLDALCDCKYKSLIKNGISEDEITKVLNGDYGILDAQFQKYIAAELKFATGIDTECLGVAMGSGK